MNVNALWARIDEEGLEEEKCQSYERDMKFLCEALYDGKLFSDVSIFENIHSSDIIRLFEEVYYFECLEGGDESSGKNNSATTLYWINSIVGFSQDIRHSNYAAKASKRGLL